MDTVKKPHKPGTPPNFHMILTPAELDYIRRAWAGKKSAAIHAALRRMMEQENDSRPE